MKFTLNDLKAILPYAQRKTDDDFIRRIGQIVIEAKTSEELETNISHLFGSRGLNYYQLVANKLLKADETDSASERIPESHPVHNELIEVVSQQIDAKAAGSNQSAPDSASTEK